MLLKQNASAAALTDPLSLLGLVEDAAGTSAAVKGAALSAGDVAKAMGDKTRLEGLLTAAATESDAALPSMLAIRDHLRQSGRLQRDMLAYHSGLLGGLRERLDSAVASDASVARLSGECDVLRGALSVCEEKERKCKAAHGALLKTQTGACSALKARQAAQGRLRTQSRDAAAARAKTASAMQALDARVQAADEELVPPG